MTVFNNNNNGSVIGAMSADEVSIIKPTITGPTQSDGSEVGRGLEALKQAVRTQQDLQERERQELLKNIGKIEQEAEVPPEKRSETLVNSALAGLTAAAVTGTELGKAIRGVPRTPGNASRLCRAT